MSEKLLDLPALKLLKTFGAGKHKPGSGSAAAFQCLLSSQLILTVISLTKDPKRRKRFASNLPKLLEIESDINTRLLPALENMLEEDSIKFGKVVPLRQQRDAEPDPYKKMELSRHATEALRSATEIPINIARHCLDIAKHGVEVFDHGFKAARGDSCFAINSALSAAFGCISIIELNLQSFEADEWTEKTSHASSALSVEFDNLSTECQQRLAIQRTHSKNKHAFSKEIKTIVATCKATTSFSEAEIENIATRLQNLIWKYRDVLWRSDAPSTPHEALKPAVALKGMGFHVHRATTLGRHNIHGIDLEVAGQIDQSKKIVSVSEQFPIEIQNFTIAHELGHSIFHTQSLLHRDRPLDKPDGKWTRNSDEWQADKFATYFLMPRKILQEKFSERFLTMDFRITEESAFALKNGTSTALREKCRNLRGLSKLLAKTTWFNGYPFHALHETFGVSVEAMAIRLEELELVSF